MKHLAFKKKAANGEIGDDIYSYVKVNSQLIDSEELINLLITEFNYKREDLDFIDEENEEEGITINICLLPPEDFSKWPAWRAELEKLENLAKIPLLIVSFYIGVN